MDKKKGALEKAPLSFYMKYITNQQNLKPILF